MIAYDIYVFLLCFIVYVLLTTLSVIVVVTITKMMLKMIKHGLEDENIRKQKQTENGKPKKYCLDNILSFFVSFLFIAVFLFSTYINLQEDSTFERIPTLRVVNSASMSKKHKKNDYLNAHNLNDHIQTFDLILTYKMPPEDDLKLYDIVVYEVDDVSVVHRIVGIEEPNKYHKDRYFLLQGDAVEQHDRYPVYYSQMKGIYRGERVPFVGSFITFLQSPAGWLCVILLVFTMIALPIVEKKLQTAIDARYALIKALDTPEENSCSKQTEEGNDEV